MYSIYSTKCRIKINLISKYLPTTAMTRWYVKKIFLSCSLQDWMYIEIFHQLWEQQICDILLISRSIEMFSIFTLMWQINIICCFSKRNKLKYKNIRIEVETRLLIKKTQWEGCLVGRTSKYTWSLSESLLSGIKARRRGPETHYTLNDRKLK